MEEYRVDIRVRNNVILKKLEENGYSSVGEFCRINKVNYASSIGNIVNMKKSPLNSYGAFRPCVLFIAKVIGCDPLDLFTDTQLHTILKTNKRVIQVNEAEMQFMIESKNDVKLLEEIVLEDQKEKKINLVLNTLTLIEKKIVEMRFGLGNNLREHTYEEIGEEENCTGNRIRQIIAKALRKIRHPSRCEELREFYED